MADENTIKRIQISQIRQEEGSRELTESADMESHLNFALALMQGHNPTPELEAIRQLPIERRYTWRIASSLKWAFADFDSVNVDAERDVEAGRSRQSDGPHEIAAHAGCILLRAMVGAEDAANDGRSNQSCEAQE